MTRQEELEQRAHAAQQRLARTRKQLAQVTAQQKKVAQQTLSKRYWRIGQLADEAGLLGLSDTTLAALFAHLGTLTEVPDPVALLDALLHDSGDPMLADVSGCAQPADGVAAVRQV